MFCRSLFVLLYLFFWPLCCLFFFDIQILITSLWCLLRFPIHKKIVVIHVQFGFNQISSYWGKQIFNYPYFGWRSVLFNIFLKGDYTNTIPAQFGLNRVRCFREDFEIIFGHNQPNLYIFCKNQQNTLYFSKTHNIQKKICQAFH